MEWIILYNIGAPHSVIWDDLLIAFVCLFAGVCILVKLEIAAEEKSGFSAKSIAQIGLLFLLIVLGVCSIVFKWIDFQVKDYNPYEKVYTEGLLTTVTSKAENVSWGGDRFLFSINDVPFECLQHRGIKREHNIERYFESASQIKVYYYADEDTSSTYQALRIDALVGKNLIE